MLPADRTAPTLLVQHRGIFRAGDTIKIAQKSGAFFSFDPLQNPLDTSNSAQGLAAFLFARGQLLQHKADTTHCHFSHKPG